MTAIGFTQNENNPLLRVLDQQANTSVDPLFREDVVNALIHGGVHVDPTHLDPENLNALVQQAWENPSLQADWNSGEFDGYQQPTFWSHLEKAFFTDPTSDLLPTGLKLLQSQGVKLTNSQIAALGPLQEQVPTPFDQQFYPNTTLTFGQQWNGETEDGIDYAMPVGTGLYTPFAGTVKREDDGKSNWGKRVFIQLDNGYTFAIGHLTNFAVVDGERVNPGELIGESGGDPSDPSSGNSSGPHVEVQWISPDGKFQDPSQIMGPIYKGSTFADLNLESAVGGGVSKTDAKYRLRGEDPYLEQKYLPTVDLWRKYFGETPSAGQILTTAAAGDAKQQEDFVRAMQSHIPGMNVGQYFDLRQLADQKMTEELGHLATDGIVKELFDAGNTTPLEVQHFIGHLSENALNAMGAQTYNAIYAANQPHMVGVYNEQGFDPRIAQQQHAAAQGGGTEGASDAANVANLLPVGPSLMPYDPRQNQQATPPPATPPPTSFAQHESSDQGRDTGLLA